MAASAAAAAAAETTRPASTDHSPAALAGVHHLLSVVKIGASGSVNSSGRGGGRSDRSSRSRDGRGWLRRQGLATALLNHVLTDVTAAGATQATLEVRRSNEPALRLYDRLGFIIAGVRFNY